MYNYTMSTIHTGEEEMSTMALPQLPDIALANILANLDAVSLCQISQTSRDFRSMAEHIARQRVMDRFGGDNETATRFKYISWKERLYLEEDTACGFDAQWYNEAGFVYTSPDKNIKKPGIPTISLAGMGPKLLISDISTADQRTIRWRLRVSGNTAVEFGCIPVGVAPSHTALHKCQPVPSNHEHRCTGFSSQITAGSLLPVKVPVMRGTELDLVARRGQLQLVLHYPQGAKEISWQNGQPVARPYRGPRKLRFELELPDDVDVKLGLTAWAKASFEMLAIPSYSSSSSISINNSSALSVVMEESLLHAEEEEQLTATTTTPVRAASLCTNNDHPLMIQRTPSSPSTSSVSSSPVVVVQPLAQQQHIVHDPPALFLSPTVSLSPSTSFDGTPATSLLLAQYAMLPRNHHASDSDTDDSSSSSSSIVDQMSGMRIHSSSDGNSGDGIIIATSTDNDDDTTLHRTDSQCNGLVYDAFEG